MARPLRRVLIDLSIRLGVIVTELEKLPVGVIAEYIARLSDKKPVQGVEAQARAVFGKPSHRKQ
jgi:hypothetical protein